jgi:hypothetical protein
MKKPTSRTMLLGATIAMPLMAQAQQFNATSQNMVFALVETYTAPALQLKDENGRPARDGNGSIIRELTYSNEFSVDTMQGEDVIRTVSTYEEASKMVTFRISNREILQQLKEENVITDIAGYSIAFVMDANEDSDDLTYKVELQKRGADPIDVTSYFDIEPLEGGGEADVYRSVTTDDFVRDTSRTVESGSGRGKQRIGVTIDTAMGDISFDGVLSWADTLRNLIDRSSGEPEPYTLYVPGAWQINAISGTLSLDGEGEDISASSEYDEEDEPSVIEGSVSMSAGVLTIRDFSSSIVE